MAKTGGRWESAGVRYLDYWQCSSITEVKRPWTWRTNLPVITTILSIWHVNLYLPAQFANKCLPLSREIFESAWSTRLCRIKATFHLTICMGGQSATGKIQWNNYRHESCGPSLTDKTSSVSLMFTQGTHRNVKNRWVRSALRDGGGAGRQPPPPPIIFEGRNWPQPTIYHWKGNLMANRIKFQTLKIWTYYI